MILITGGTGHLGNVLTRKLVNLGEKVVVFTHPADNCESLEDLNVPIIKGDIRDYKKLESISKNADVIFHLAAIISILPWKKRYIEEVNVNGTKNIIKIAKKYNKKLVYVSSVHAFAEPKVGGIIDENTTIDPKLTSGIYGKSKAKAALEILNASKAGLNVTTICPTGIIGPYDYKPSEMGKLFLNYLKNKIKLIVEGEFDFVDVRDVADILIKALDKGKKGEFYIISNKTIKISKIFEILDQITGKKTKLKIIDKNTALIASIFNLVISSILGKKPLFTPYSIHTLSRKIEFSHKKAEKELNFNPRDFYSTLYDTICWLSEHFLNQKIKYALFTH
ncbi:MAG: NAD-dependent epimerase/dehydratase family protein [Thermosipho sp. (in: Bacteria)]|nr:NAD-dependent epimerase/dehydratase family protein [Thermosipho sp. (in: thermotogales)]